MGFSQSKPINRYRAIRNIIPDENGTVPLIEEEIKQEQAVRKANLENFLKGKVDGFERNCGCYLPESVYDEYVEGILAQFGDSNSVGAEITRRELEGRKKCIFPGCSSRTQYYKPNNCGDVSICVQGVDFNIGEGGTLQTDELNIDQRAECDMVFNNMCQYNRVLSEGPCINGVKELTLGLSDDSDISCPTTRIVVQDCVTPGPEPEEPSPGPGPEPEEPSPGPEPEEPSPGPEPEEPSPGPGPEPEEPIPGPGPEPEEPKQEKTDNTTRNLIIAGSVLTVIVLIIIILIAALG